MNIILFILLSLFSPLDKSSNSEVTISCPPDVWLPCNSEIWDLSGYGTAYYYVNGNQYNAGQAEVSYDLTTCQTGKIYRTWSVEDHNWNIISCTQTIYINGGNFNHTNIYWPEREIQLLGCNASTRPENLPEEYARPSFDYVSCSMVGTSYKDQVFQFGPDCKKVLRTWTVLDWCNYYPGSNNQGIWTYTQTIKVSNDGEPRMQCPQDVEVIPQNCEGAYVSLEDVITDAVPCNGNYEIINNSTYADAQAANASGFYPIGSTDIIYSMEYACGEETYCYQNIRVLEKNPVPYCLSELNVALMPLDTDSDGLVDDGMVELWAKDLDFASYHPCYPNEQLTFSFSANTDSSFVVFSCQNVGENEMQLWVTDTRGNQSWCAVTVDVQNNAANIPDCEPDNGNRELYGQVTNQFGEALENVFIELKSRAYYEKGIAMDTVMEQIVVDSIITPAGLIIYFYDQVERVIPVETNTLIPGERINLLTDSIGQFLSPDINPSRNYKMTAYRYPENDLIGDDDLASLKSYLSGDLNEVTSLFIIAADINEDGNVNYEDLDILTDINSGDEDEWPNERQWMFYDASELESLQTGTHPIDENIRPEIMLEQNMERFDEQTFIGIAKGDLSAYLPAKDDVVISQRNKKVGKASIYPNPFSDVMSIESTLEGEADVRIFNINGQLIYQKNIESTRVLIEESRSWERGTYMYTISTKTETVEGKVIKL